MPRRRAWGGSRGGALTALQLRDVAGITSGMVKRLFPKGQFRELRRLAGLVRPTNPSMVSREAALTEYHRVALKLGGIPSWSLFHTHGEFSPQVLIKRFGGRAGLMKEYGRWLRAHGHKRPGPTLSKRSPRRTGVPQDGRGAAEKHRGDVGRNPKVMVLGAPLDFRGLLHEPTNEMGVIYLFGAAAVELGFMVDGFRPAFPDCEAKRLVRGTRQRWQRCLIEFELLSSNFAVHHHDPKGCDLIVCWEHDWPECPVPVLELKSQTRRLMASQKAADAGETRVAIDAKAA